MRVQSRSLHDLICRVSLTHWHRLFGLLSPYLTVFFLLQYFLLSLRIFSLFTVLLSANRVSPQELSWGLKCFEIYFDIYQDLVFVTKSISSSQRASWIQLLKWPLVVYPETLLKTGRAGWEETTPPLSPTNRNQWCAHQYWNILTLPKPDLYAPLSILQSTYQYFWQFSLSEVMLEINRNTLERNKTIKPSFESPKLLCLLPG